MAADQRRHVVKRVSRWINISKKPLQTFINSGRGGGGGLAAALTSPHPHDRLLVFIIVPSNHILLMSSVTYGRGKLLYQKINPIIFFWQTRALSEIIPKSVIHQATPRIIRTYKLYSMHIVKFYITTLTTQIILFGSFVLVPDWFESTRVFEAIGLIAAIVGLLFLVLYTCVSKTSGNKIVAFLTAILTLGTGKTFNWCIRLISHIMIVLFFLIALFFFITGGVIMLGVIIYGSKVDTDYLQWAFALTAASGCLYVISGILLFVSMCSK